MTSTIFDQLAIFSTSQNLQNVQCLIRCMLICPNQSAYRKGHGTETALPKIQNEILMSVSSQHVVLLVLLDLSAVFDTVDHSVLLSRLKSSFGIRGTALRWFSSYLSGRIQRISLDGYCSDTFDLQEGVPQGSCLGPLLFKLYACKLFEVVGRRLPSVHTYADDTQLYLLFKPESASSAQDAVDAMEHGIRAWMLWDKLKISDGKSEFMVIGTRQQLSKVHISSIKMLPVYLQFPL